MIVYHSQTGKVAYPPVIEPQQHWPFEQKEPKIFINQAEFWSLREAHLKLKHGEEDAEHFAS